MIDSSALRAFRNTLALVPVDWVLWALDADEKYAFLEGPGLERMGVRPSDKLGRSLAEANPDNPELVAFGRKCMRKTGTDRVAIRGCTLLLSGGPAEGGGSVGIGMLLEEARPTEPCRVLELTRDMTEAGARRGDLLVADPSRPGRVGLYREIDLTLLLPTLREEVRGLTNRESPAESPCPAWPRTAERRPARAAHLRLLP